MLTNIDIAALDVMPRIAALDVMLGYRKESLPPDQIAQGSLPRGSLVLLRGGPGTGKTTLVLQIINKFLEGERHRAVFICLESDPREVIDHARDAFGFQSLRRDEKGSVPRLCEVSKDDCTKVRVPRGSERLPANADSSMCPKRPTSF